MALNVEQETRELKARLDDHDTVAQLTGQFEFISGQLNAMQRFMHAKFDAIDKRFDAWISASTRSSPMLALCARIFPGLLWKQCAAFYGQAKQAAFDLPRWLSPNWGFEFSGPAFGCPDASIAIAHLRWGWAECISRRFLQRSEIIEEDFQMGQIDGVVGVSRWLPDLDVVPWQAGYSASALSPSFTPPR